MCEESVDPVDVTYRVGGLPVPGEASLPLEDVMSWSPPPWPDFVRKQLKYRGVAEEIAKLSKDRSTKVGAIALGIDCEVLGVSYNGFPRGIIDDIDARHERPIKYRYTSHAEENLVSTAARVGVSLRHCTVLVTSLFPCTTCSRLMIQAGVANIIAPRVDRPDWAEEAELALSMLHEAGVNVYYYEP